MREKINFTTDFGPKATQSIIKVIGVGGGGGNAVQHMYKEGIIGVDFLICNTDRNALEASPIPFKLVLGESGLGAGANPEVARTLALESREQIINFIGKDTKMLFITAGMGKGTGTGAAPVVAEIAREMGILTIAVVTLPFKFEGTTSAQFAEAGVAELRKYVDSLITIKNQNIIKYYNDETLSKAFGYVDDILKNAVKCIAELITVNLQRNIDFNDICSIMKDSGAAMLGIAEASGENRIQEVLESVLRCPLLTEEHISDAKNFLFSICYGSEEELLVNELETLVAKFDELKSQNSHVIWGSNEDPSLGKKIKLSVIISRYATDQREDTYIEPVPKIYEGEKQKNVLDVNRGNTVFSPSSPDNMKSVIADESIITQNNDTGIGFGEVVVTSEVVAEPVKIPVSNLEFVAGPHNMNPTYEYEYSDEKFEQLKKPAIERMRQENKEEFQNNAVQNTPPPRIETEDDVHLFFKELPD